MGAMPTGARQRHAEQARAQIDFAHVDEHVLRDRETVQVALVAAQGRFRLAAAVAEVPRFAGEARAGGSANLGQGCERAWEFLGLAHGAVLYASRRSESWYTAAIPRGRGHDMSGNGTSARGVRQVGYFDCAGGGQVVVDGRVAFVAHMKAPHGTTIVDVSDPSRPRQLASIEVPPGTHSHKVRAGNGLMLVNREAHGGQGSSPNAPRGLGIYDVSNPSRPREITLWRSGGTGVHRFTFDGRYAYISPEMDGYVGNIVMILDLADPSRPQEVGRWWMPGQWTAGGETPTWSGRQHRCHHPIREGNRLYVSYWHGGFVILDIEDMAKPRFVSGLDWSPPFLTPTHTALPVPFPLHGRKVMLVADEDVAKLAQGPPSFLWLVDISDEKKPGAVRELPGGHATDSPSRSSRAAISRARRSPSTEIPVAWFAHGLRIVDIANPHAPREVGALPAAGAGGLVARLQ